MLQPHARAWPEQILAIKIHKSIAGQAFHRWPEHGQSIP